jgi:hypothetical protein
MLDKAIKIAQWMWLIKERVVLLIVLSVLAFRLFGIVNPPKPPEIKNYIKYAPIPDLPLEAMPSTPRPAPSSGVEDGYNDLTTKNPFLYKIRPATQPDN